jgi:hypothetical protein
MKPRLISNKVKVLLASLLVITALLLIAAAPVYAYGQFGPIPAYPISSRYTDAQLSAMFRRDKDLLTTVRGAINQQRGNITMLDEKFLASELGDHTDATLEKREADLMAAAAPLDRAQDLVASAQLLVGSHPGFDLKDNVVNKLIAANTISTLDALLSNAQYWLTRSTDLTSTNSALGALPYAPH